MTAAAADLAGAAKYANVDGDLESQIWVRHYVKSTTSEYTPGNIKFHTPTKHTYVSRQSPQIEGFLANSAANFW